MIRTGLGISIFGVFVALTAVMLVFIGNPSTAVPITLLTLLVGVPIVAVLGVAAFRRHRTLGGPAAALRACPHWLLVTLLVLLSLVLIAVLAIWLATSATGEALPLRFYVPVLALAVFSITLGLFSGLLVLQERRP